MVKALLHDNKVYRASGVGCTRTGSASQETRHIAGQETRPPEFRLNYCWIR